MSAAPVAIGLSAAISLAGALLFVAVTLLTGDYSWTARVGGGLWIFLLAMIILLPTLMPWLREQQAGRSRNQHTNGN
jgi:hypothetical protein